MNPETSFIQEPITLPLLYKEFKTLKSEISELKQKYKILQQNFQKSLGKGNGKTISNSSSTCFDDDNLEK